DRLVFGKINYWTMCKQLKKVMAECGIEKQISYHCARHHHLSYTLKISSL
ncbi:MAG: site-specific integrase, partial [Alistipes sp.]|nr:site-specific integrase [Alistipes sp.]